MKKTRILFWIFTIIIFLFEGVMPALTSNTELAKEGIRHLGYPDYFRMTLTIFKVAGAIILVVPALKGRIKEWAYAGFAFDFIFATVSHVAVDGFSLMSLFPLLFLIILAASYYYYHKLNNGERQALSFA